MHNPFKTLAVFALWLGVASWAQVVGPVQKAPTGGFDTSQINHLVICDSHYSTVQECINAAGTSSSVLIPFGQHLGETFTNSHSIAVDDERIGIPALTGSANDATARSAASAAVATANAAQASMTGSLPANGMSSSGGNLVVPGTGSFGGQITGTTAVIVPVALSSLGTCPSSATPEGTLAAVRDSLTNVVGATITGGGTNHVNAYCNGSAWVVQSGQPVDTTARTALSGSAYDSTARNSASSAQSAASAAQTASSSAQTTASSAQSAASSAQSAATAAQTSASSAQSTATSAQNTANAAQATANAALPANGATSAGTGTSNTVTLPGTMKANKIQIGTGPVISGTQGNGVNVFTCTGTFPPGNLVSVDTNGNCIDSGMGPGTVSYNGSVVASVSDNGRAVKMACTTACTYTLPNPWPAANFHVTILATGSVTPTVVLAPSATFMAASTPPTVPAVIWANSGTSFGYMGYSIVAGSTGGTGGTTGSGIANIQVTTGTARVPGNSCTANTAAAMPGLLATSAVDPPTPTSSTNNITGWGSSGGLGFAYYVTANTFNWSICNATSSDITPSASLTWNVGAR